MSDPVIPDIPPTPEVPPYPALGAANFNQMAYNVGSKMPGVVSGIRAIAQAAWECAKAALYHAQQALGASGAAKTESDAAMGYRNQAGQYATTAGQKADIATAAQGEATRQAGISAAQAALSNQAREQTELARNDVLDAKSETIQARDKTKEYRDQAEVFASGQLKATSASNVTPGAGAKAFAVEPSRSFVAGMYLVATSTGAPGTQMSGPVQSYDPATGALVIAVDTFSGAAARTDWVIGVAAKGANGMAQQLVTGDMVAVPGVVYVFTVAAATLKLPETGLTDDSEIAFVLATDVSRNQVVDFGALPFRGMLAGKRFLNKRGFALRIRHNTTLGGWV